MNYQDLDAQAKWEITALNALEHAAQANWIMTIAIKDAVESGQHLNPAKFLEFIRENQVRLQRDLRELRRITIQREKEEES